MPRRFQRPKKPPKKLKALSTRGRCTVPPHKVRFATEFAALVALATGAGEKGSIRAYGCEFCGGWHTTSQPKRGGAEEAGR